MLMARNEMTAIICGRAFKRKVDIFICASIIVAKLIKNLNLTIQMPQRCMVFEEYQSYCLLKINGNEEILNNYFYIEQNKSFRR